MLKQILELSRIELLSKEELKTIKGGELVGKCAVWAPSGSSPSLYPFYPCAHDPSKAPTLCTNPADELGPPILC